MNSTIPTYRRGDTVCRPTDWVDVARFFLLNYGLHAVTVVMEPGSTALACFLASFTAIMLPSGGVARAVRAVDRFAVWGTTDLDVGLRSGALCMVVPVDLPARPSPPETPETENGERNAPDSRNTTNTQQSMSMGNYNRTPGAPPQPNSSAETGWTQEQLVNYWVELKKTLLPISVDLTHVHGEYPKDLKHAAGSKNLEEGAAGRPSNIKYVLVDVPRHFQVFGLVGPLETKDHSELIKDWLKRRLKEMGGWREGAKDWSKKHLTRTNKTDERRESATPASITNVSTAELEVTSIEQSGTRAETTTLQEGNRASKPVKAVSVRLSSNYSFVKTVAAIIQILYGSFELYKIGKDEIGVYGYTTYQLTAVPYIFMSLANLIASLTGPSYPSKYLVYYRGLRKPSTDNGGGNLYPPGWWKDEDREEVEAELGGVVGVTYGKFVNLKEGNTSEYSREWLDNHQVEPGINYLKLIFIFLFTLVFLAGPYLTILSLAGFKPGNSTLSQRAWILGWYFVGYTGQVALGLVLSFPSFRKFRIGSPRRALAIITTCTILLSIPTVGGLVVVGQMMKHRGTCQLL